MDRHGKERPIGSRSAARNAVKPQEMFFLEEDGLPHERREAHECALVLEMIWKAGQMHNGALAMFVARRDIARSPGWPRTMLLGKSRRDGKMAELHALES